VKVEFERAIILFVRKPQLSRVKTRLAADVGDVRALEIYNLLLSHTHQVVSKVDAQVYVFYAEEIETDDLWSDIAYRKVTQVNGDLGAKMKVAFSTVLQSCKNVLIIGSDCAQLRPKHLEEAWSKLETEDLVIGPSMDGGYYLLGIKAAYNEMFDDIPWSTEAVAKLTKERAQKLGLSMVELDTLSDIDYREDWEKYGAPFILDSETN